MTVTGRAPGPYQLLRWKRKSSQPPDPPKGEQHASGGIPVRNEGVALLLELIQEIGPTACAISAWWLECLGRCEPERFKPLGDFFCVGIDDVDLGGWADGIGEQR